MAQVKHYSPAIDRQIVCALYHEGKRRQKPMTKLVNELLSGILCDTEGWKTALTQLSVLQEKPTQRYGVKR